MNIGIVPQDIAIYEELTAYENVKFFAGLYGLRGAELKARVEEALQFVGLSDKTEKLSEELFWRDETKTEYRLCDCS